MPLNISIVDFGMGNLHSVYKKISQLNAHPIITNTADEILKADKIILPGIGHFKKAIDNLHHLRIYDALNEAVLIKKTPILGICLGMQLMANEGEEGNATGLQWFDARVVRFTIQNKIKYKIPQTGWNTIRLMKESCLFKNIDAQSEFYFLHAFHLEASDHQDILTKTEFEYNFVSAIEKENIFGTQFHPEKSHRAGGLLLKNFIQL